MAFPKTFYRWRPHPWHGLEAHDRSDENDDVVNAYIEMTPFDAVKYEVDKTTGYLRVDRPQLTSSMTPTLYGFIPQTYCSARVDELSPSSVKGDGDPLDICVITERPINRSEVILRARVIGGMQMVDHGEADDKIIAVLDNDQFWQDAHDIKDVSPALIERMRHYFETYKLVPGQPSDVIIPEIYGREHALKVIKASMLDYTEEYG
jgi:inorganic pyrophosphatase